MSDWSSFVVAALGAAGGSAVVVAALAGWLGSVWKERIARVETLLGQIDTDLRAHRLKVYPELWQSMAFLPKWPRDDSVSYEQLLEFSKTLRQWYFYTGGMFLSRSSQRDGYAPLQDTIAAILQAKPSGPLSVVHYDEVRERCSRLRTLLTADIESRREAVSVAAARSGV
jgi:hypothetical protein